MFKNTFLLKIYPKVSKKLKVTSICTDEHGFFNPSDHCAVIVKSKWQKLGCYISWILLRIQKQMIDSKGQAFAFDTGSL